MIESGGLCVALALGALGAARLSSARREIDRFDFGSGPDLSPETTSRQQRRALDRRAAKGLTTR